MCQTRKYKNSNSKYTIAAFDEVPERPNTWYIFEKRIVQGYQKLYTGTSVSRFGIFPRMFVLLPMTEIQLISGKIWKKSKV